MLSTITMLVLIKIEKKNIIVLFGENRNMNKEL